MQQEVNPTTENRTKHTIYKNILITCLRKAKELYYKELVSHEEQNLIILWTIFGDIINPHKAKVKTQIDKLIYSNKTMTTNEHIATILNEPFCSIGEKLATKHTGHHIAHKQYLKYPNTHSLFLSPTNEKKP